MKIRLPAYIGIFTNENGENEIVPYYSIDEVLAVVDATPEDTEKTMAIFKLDANGAVFGTHGGVRFLDPFLQRQMDGNT